ncbi:hypothetical protein PFISCL1PPCAC_16518 [Pristionchus fissidentatus]|uniref:Exonuclease domain-containing protein n=1 Tax=Pristionchus fissidentatus TaxID=1538716 RepID=A0AAV5W3B2_9BILA|nr:hypothetical protein PFISCL1PPCAC_16518 [Pristionchus fissidentatus]
MNPRDEQLLTDYYEKLTMISEEVEKEERRGESGGASSLVKPPENSIPTHVTEKIRIMDSRNVEMIYRHIHKMSATDMRAELKEIHKSPHGSVKDLRTRLTKFYRKEFAQIHAMRDDRIAQEKTRQRFRYLVAVDIEATCEQRTNDINYQHEIIELPAVLIDCDEFAIVDKFRTYVRPEINPQLSPFCATFVHISQADVDAAPTFPEAWSRLLEWMSRHGMMGTDPEASFAVVTDGPNDVQHFLQRSFLQYNMAIPHEFRHFINIKKSFEFRVETLIKGDGRSSIDKMCEKLGLDFDETKQHQGIEDSLNVAKIAIALVVEKDMDLFINQRIVRNRRIPLELPKFATEKEIMALQAALKSRNRGDQKVNSNNCAADRLPFQLKSVNRDEFNTGAYWDCDSCDERRD